MTYLKVNKEIKWQTLNYSKFPLFVCREADITFSVVTAFPVSAVLKKIVKTTVIPLDMDGPQVNAGTSREILIKTEGTEGIMFSYV